MRNNGMRYHTMPEVEKRGWEAVMETALREAREGTDKLFISFDVDVLDPAFVPGTGTPVPGGLTMREAIPIVRRLCPRTTSSASSWSSSIQPRWSPTARPSTPISSCTPA
jgi:arginase family enzyme